MTAQIVNIICGWCKGSFYKDISLDRKGEHPLINCPHCARLLPASKKVSTGNFVGRKHIHEDYKNGDIAA